MYNSPMGEHISGHLQLDAHAQTKKEKPTSGPLSWIVIANRLPTTSIPIEDDITGQVVEWNYSASGGGLVTGLSRIDGVYVGFNGTTRRKQDTQENENFAEASRTNRGKIYRLLQIPMSTEALEGYYEHFCQGLWEIWHRLKKPFIPSENDRDFYEKVDKTFAKGALTVVEPENIQNTVAFSHDYHQALTNATIKEAQPDLTTVHFTHTYFPSVKDFSVLRHKDRSLIVGGMLRGNDILGFQTDECLANFVENVVHLFPSARVTSENGKPRQVHYKGRDILLGAYPISIDAKAFEENGQKPEVIARAEAIRAEHMDGTRSNAYGRCWTTRPN